MPSSPILEALKSIPPTGANGFEALAADLFSSLTGIPFRLCSAGLQDGVDALPSNAIPVAIEFKHYGKSGLNLRQLQGQLVAAVERYPWLQLWILATTQKVSATHHKALEATGKTLGVSILIVDKSMAGPELPTVSALEALCAVNPSRFCQSIPLACRRPGKISSTKSDKTKLINTMRAVARKRGHKQWRTRIKNEILQFPIWNILVKRHNQRLAASISRGVKSYLGTPFRVTEVIKRGVRSVIHSLCCKALVATNSRLHVVLGERYDGKTWLVLDWLHSVLPTLHVPVFFVPSSQGLTIRNFTEYCRDELSRPSPQYRETIEAVLRRRQSIDTATTPWGVAIIDGLNEYLDQDQGVANVLDALAQNDAHIRGCATFVTVRPKSWQDIKPTFTPDIAIHEILVTPYDDEEFKSALKLHGLPPRYEKTIPEKARLLIRRPRYFDLVVKHRQRLGSFAPVTPEVLAWLDITDKIGRSRPRQEWDEHRYEELLRECAKEMRAKIQLTLTEVSRVVQALTDQRFAVIKDLESEGVLVKEAQGYRIREDHLVIGIALYILHTLQVCPQSTRPLTEALRDLLAPLGETDATVASLQAAVSVAVLSQTPFPILDVLVKEWLTSRNLPPDTIQNVQMLGHALLPCLLRIAPESWSTQVSGKERLQEISRKLFIEMLPTHRSEVREAIGRWFRMVPEGGSFHFQKWEADKGRDSRLAVRSAMDKPTLNDLGLISTKYEGILSLHRVGISIISIAPGLLAPETLLALLGSMHAAHDSLSDGEVFVFRQALANVPNTWFESQVRGLSPQKDVRKTLLHQLISLADRADLRNLTEETADPPPPEALRWRHSQSLSREQYIAVKDTPFSENEKPYLFADRIKALPRDPSLPSPSSERMDSLRSHLLSLREARLYDGMSMTREQHIFEATLPITAAWFPELGRDIVLKQIHDLPNREATRPLAGALSRHAPLLDDSTIESLFALTRTSASSQQVRDRGLEEILLSLLPAMTPNERIEALISRPAHQHEWTTLYELAGFLVDPKLLQRLLEQLSNETDEVRVRRLRFVLSNCHHPLTPSIDREPLIHALRAQGDNRFSALLLASHSSIYDLPADVLTSIATEKDSGRNDGSYASYLLTKSSSVIPQEVFNDLPPYLRAYYAAARNEYAEAVADEIELALHDLQMPAKQPLDGMHIPHTLWIDNVDEEKGVIRWGLPSGFLSGRVNFRSSESTVGGFAHNSLSLSQAMDDMTLSSEAAAQKMNTVCKGISEVLQKRAAEQKTCWGMHLFPLPLIEKIARLRPDSIPKWARYLVSRPKRACDFWAGLVLSLFIYLLRCGDELARDLWELVRPFKTTRVFLRIQVSMRGVNSLFCHLSDSSSDETLSQRFLKDLILSATNDAELFELTVGARMENATRLTSITRSLLRDADTGARARAVRIAGWLEGLSEDLRPLSSDPSLWVRTLVALSLQSTQEEIWARHWLTQSLRSTDALARWRANQLFLSCVDGRYAAWAWDILQSAEVSDRTRGECWLLLDEARSICERHLRTLRDTFLGHKVRDLEAVCHPWLHIMEWDELSGTNL